jgi:hypothetical protein
VVEAELSLVPLYEGQALYREIIDRLETLGFDLITIDRAFTHPRTGHVLQVDGVFARADGTRPRAPLSGAGGDSPLAAGPCSTKPPVVWTNFVIGLIAARFLGPESFEYAESIKAGTG